MAFVGHLNSNFDGKTDRENANSEDELSDDFDDELGPSIFQTIAQPTLQSTKSLTKQNSPSHHRCDPEALATYIYPTNLQVRDYQYNIVQRAIYHNTLVVLPTGLGKTFIASTVILNYSRWFPDSKIVFMAPTRPLVAQQIKACCGITGLPPSKIAILLDMTRRNRAEIWEDKKVFFATPQVVENDLKLGTVSPKSISLLVIDEAHRAKGNYAYNNVVKFMNRFNPHYRILAMTATPASTIEGVQEIIDNLHISRAEVRTESSIDIYRYLKQKTIERFHAHNSGDVTYALSCIYEAIAPILSQANEKRIYDVTDPAKINFFTAMDASRRLVANRAVNDGSKWSGRALLQVISMAGQCIRRLSIYGIRSFYSYFKEKYNESFRKTGKKRNQTSESRFIQHAEINKLMKFCEQKIADPLYLGHEKLEIAVSEVKRFFSTTQNADSRVIIFSEFREAALDIVRALQQSGDGLKPHIFIGQSKDSKADDSKTAGSNTKAARKAAKELASIDGQASSELAQQTGMSQKVQKETIKSFKQGKYNILVATSIGEEGLDIGEVDLIVCYDSTSSPIKNVQRMGRTGRNRDGKILLLFSGNEESKFDRAMGGYEYIQQHIMNGNMISLYDQKRIIPADFTPTVEERFIEIPEENNAIKEEADEDEIIKIATKYMTGKNTKTKASTPTSTSGKRGKKGTSQAKVQKKFFMPDNVTTGFLPVSSMVREAIESPDISLVDPQEPRPTVDSQRKPDILDQMLDSDLEISDSEVVPSSKISPNEKIEKLSPNKEMEFEADLSEGSIDARIHSSSEPKRSPKPISDSFGKTAHTPRKYFRQPQIDSVVSQAKTLKRTAPPSLGVRKRPVNVVDQLKARAVATKRQSEQLPIQVLSDREESGIEQDDFPDDDEILALAWRTQSGEWQNTSEGSRDRSRNSAQDDPAALDGSCVENEELEYGDPRFLEEAHISSDSESHSLDSQGAVSGPLETQDVVHVASETDGILTAQEWSDLYMNYYVPVDEEGLDECGIPQFSGGDTQRDFISSKSRAMLRVIEAINTMSDSKAEHLKEKYKILCEKPLPPLKDLIEYE